VTRQSRREIASAVGELDGGGRDRAELWRAFLSGRLSFAEYRRRVEGVAGE
jgi:hypothetical protein